MTVLLQYRMSSEQALALWKSQIPIYQKVITKCCNRIITPLTRFLPSDFDEKIIELKQILNIREQEQYQKYINVIVHFIQGIKNKSIIQLADLLMQELGGSLKYWQYIIVDVAEQITYTNQLSIWQVRKIYQEKLYIDSQNLSNHRRLCKLVKLYITALSNLIKNIAKFDIKKDNLSRIDDLFKKVKNAQEKYAGFSQQMKGGQNSNIVGEFSNNLSHKSKQNAIKDLFHYRQPNKLQRIEGERNTLLNYNFKINNKALVQQRVSGPTKNIKQTKKAINGNRLEIFEIILKNIKNENMEISQLQQIFKISKHHIFNQQCLLYNITTIWDKDYYFSYIAHPIEMDKFKQFTHPFQHHEWINYQINSDDEYQDLIGQDVQYSSQISSVSQDSRNSFIVSDDHLSDDEDVDHSRKQPKPKIINVYQGRWVFNVNDKNTIDGLPGNVSINNLTIILVDSKLKYPIQTLQKNEYEEILYRIVDGKDKISIMQALSKQKLKISKVKIKQFLQKKCKSIPSLDNPNKIIYKIIEHLDECSIDQKQNISKQSQLVPIDIIDDKSQSNTNIYQPQYFSQLSNDLLIQQSKKRKSQLLRNHHNFKSNQFNRNSIVNKANNSV